LYFAFVLLDDKWRETKIEKFILEIQIKRASTSPPPKKKDFFNVEKKSWFMKKNEIAPSFSFPRPLNSGKKY